MKRLRSLWHWIAERLRDAFYYSGNQHLDIGRVLAFLGPTALVGAAIWNMHLRQPIDLGPGGLGGGFAAVLTASAGFLAAKAWERRSSSTVTTTTTTPPNKTSTTTITPGKPQ